MSALSLEQALAALPETPDGIAAYLRERGIQGQPGSACSCALAVYLISHGMSDPMVCTTGISALVGGTRQRKSAPRTAIAQFIRWFDAGDYPALVGPRNESLETS
jgi:hypothetical protein